VNTSYRPTRWSWMIDYNPSEFSRIRLQLATDRSRQDATDNQVFVQYLDDRHARVASEHAARID
jgi:hypothetical protein